MKKRQRDRETGRRGDGRSLFLVMAALLLLGAQGLAQRATGTISGRVVSTDGQPIHRARIELIGVGDPQKMLASQREVYTDESGNFFADKLEPAPYTLTASAPGYVLLPPEQVSGQLGSSTNYTHIGETVTIRLQRGGVITGRVLTAAGEPVIGITIEPTRIRDEKGRAVTDALTVNELGFGRQTDDRGVYRVFGLAPGTYVVSVGAGALGFSLKPTPFAGRAKIYHPSSTRDTATEVVVQSGAEVSSIDIRYRAERGAALTGKVLGASGGGPAVAAMMPTAMVILTKPGTDTLLGTAVVMPIGDNTGYSFYGLPKGDYEVTAARPDVSQANGMISASRRVTIKGDDVTGVDLRLLAMASISGSVGLEKLAPTAAAQGCKASRDSFLDEILLAAQPDDAQPKASSKNLLLGLSSVASPNELGAFTIHSLQAGRHFLAAQLPDDHWFVKSVVLASAPASNPAIRDAGRHGLNVKAGEKITDVRVTLAEGAAGLKGKVTATGKLPSRLRIHLIPAEPDAKDEVLRYAETRAEEDGAFAFAHLAPGKYLLLARLVAETELPDKPAKPAAWDAAERAKLRKEAEAVNTSLELKPCQRVTDFVLRWNK